MTWIMLSLRRAELQQSISNHTYEELQISRQMKKLSNFANAIGDGNINPNEITSLGSELFGDALDFMGYSHEAAAQVAQEKTDYFAQAYDSLTQEEYYNNPGIASRAELYYVDGQLDTSTMYSKFYEEALKDYAQNYLMPVLKAKEEELEEKKTEIETMLEAEQAELEQVKNATSQAIQSSTIKLS